MIHVDFETIFHLNFQWKWRGVRTSVSECGKSSRSDNIFKGPDTLEIFPLLGRPHHHNLYNNKTRLVYCFKFGN